MKKQILTVLLALMLLLSGCQTGTDIPETTQPVTETTAPQAQELTLAIQSESPIFNLSGSDRLCAVIHYQPDGSGLLRTLSPQTGEQLGETALGDANLDLMVFSGGVATWNWADRLLEVYSDTLEPLWKRTLADNETGMLQRDDCFYIFTEDRTITRVSLNDQTEQSMELPDGLLAVDILVTCNSRTLVRCTDEKGADFHYFWADWASGTPEQAKDFGFAASINRNSFYNALSGCAATYLEHPDKDCVYRISGSHLWVLESTEDAVLLADDDNVLALCDLQSGTISRVRTPAGYTTVVLCGDYVALKLAGSEGDLYFWNPALSETEGNAAETMTLAELTAQNDAIAAELTERTGMPIFFGEAGTGYNKAAGTLYESDPVTDPLTIRLALEQLEAVIDDYPEGIFQEMCTEAFQPIEVYLSGPIRGSGQGSSLVSASGFTAYTGDAQVVVLDISSILDGKAFRGTVVHEFMHVMENRINEQGWNRDINYLDYWTSFLPSKDLYHYGYHDGTGQEVSDNAYTAFSDTPPEEVLFLDAYSRTMPQEDRARILEYLYLGEGSMYADVLQTGVMARKAQYLCAVIRECFPSCQIEGKLPWEKLVDTVPFSEYEQSVPGYLN